MTRARALAALALMPAVLAGLLLVAWFAYTLLAPSGSSAAPMASSSLACTVRDTACDEGEVEVFRMSALANAHAAAAGSPTYDKVVCCTGVTNLGTDCSGTYDTVLRLSADDNAHVQATGSYPTEVCLSADTPVVNCMFDDSCPTGYACLATASGSDNAHVADCDGTDDYPTKVCCYAGASPLPPGGTEYYDVRFTGNITLGGSPLGTLVATGTAKVIREDPHWEDGKQCADYHIESLALTGNVGGVDVEVKVGEGLTVPVSSGTTCEGTEGFDVTLSLYVEEWDEGASLASGGFTLQTDDPKYCSCCTDCGMEEERWSSIECTAVVSEDPPDQITYDCGDGYDLCDCETDDERVRVDNPDTGGLLFGPVGGIAELPGATADSDQSARSSSGSGFNYTALGGALAAAAVLVLGSGAWLARRRWGR